MDGESAVEVTTPPTPASTATARTILFGSGPRFAREGFGPVLAFYLGWKLVGLAAGIGAATLVALLAFRLAKREERTGALPKMALGFVCLQAGVGLLSGSARVYLAQPVLLSGGLGVAFLASAFTSRPLIGIFAAEMHSFPDDVRESETFRRIFARISIVWGCYQLARSAMRLLVLTQTSVDSYVVVNFATGFPMIAAMFSWTTWYAVRSFRRSREWGWAFDEEAGGREPGLSPAT